MRNLPTKVFLCSLCLSLSFLSSCGKNDDGVKNLKLAHSLDNTHPVHKAMEFMAARAAKKTGGKLKIDIYPGEQLGSERECIEQLQLGGLAMTKTSSGPLESFVPQMQALGLPYVFRDSQHKRRFFKSEAGRKLLTAGEAVGLKGLCFYDAGARSFYTTKKAVRTVSDLKGLKIRVQKSQIALDMVKQFGASPTPIDWGELYTALQQGVVDGAENNPPSFELSRHYEICRYYTLDEHTQQPDIILISTSVWNSLSPQMQQAIQEAAEESVPYYEKLWDEKVKSSLQTIKNAGVDIIIPDVNEFAAAVKPLAAKFKNTEIGKILEAIKNIE